MIQAESIIRAATTQVDNIRGMYGRETQITLYVHSYEALARILTLEGYRVLPFKATLKVDAARVPDPCGVAIEYVPVSSRA